VGDPLRYPLCGLCEAEIKKTHLAGPGQRGVRPNRAGGFYVVELEAGMRTVYVRKRFGDGSRRGSCFIFAVSLLLGRNGIKGLVI
jgi:hypothetical protein